MRYSWRHQELISQTSPEEFERQSLEGLQLSDYIVSTFQDFIQHSRDAEGEKVALILNEYQVFYSRWVGRFDDENYFQNEREEERSYHTTSWAYLYAITSAVFSHARGEDDSIQRPDYTDDNVASALRLTDILFSHEDALAEAIGLYQRRFDRNFR